MNGYYITQQETSNTYRAFAFLNAAAAQHFIAAHRLRGVRRGYAGRGRRLGPVEDMRDYDPEIEELAKEAKMTTTSPTETHDREIRGQQLPHQREKANAPQPPATATPRSAAHQEVIELRADLTVMRDEIAYLRDLIMRQHAELKETFTHMAEGRGFDRIHTDDLHHAVNRVIALLESKPAQAAAIAPQAAQPTTTTPADNGGTIKVMQAIAIKKGNGQGTIKITTTDPRFSKYGVTVWPEDAEALGIDPDTLHYGSTPFEKKIKVAVNNGRSKAIGLA